MTLHLASEGAPYSQQDYGHLYLAKVASLYALFSTIWIFVSDKLVALVIHDPATASLISILKGWLFIGVTTTLLYLLVKKFLKTVSLQDAKLRKTIETLERAEKDLRTLINGLPIAVATNALEGHESITFLNDHFVRTFGYTLDDIPTIDEWAVRAYPDTAYRTEVFRVWDAALERTIEEYGHVETMEFRVTGKDGRVRDTLFNAVVLENQLLITLLDITERRQAEKLLAEKSRELDLARRELERTAFDLTENIPVGTYTMVLPPGGTMAHFSYLSKRFLELCGLDRATTQRDPLQAFTIVHPDDYDQWVQLNAEAFTRKEPFFGQCRIVVHDETRWITAESIPRDLPDGSTVWEGVLIDVTDRVRMEDKLRQSEELFRLAFENANTGMCLVDLQDRFLHVNDKMCAIFGYSQQELEGMTSNDLTVREDLAISPIYKSKAIQGLVDSVAYDKHYRHRDGHLIHAQVASSLVRDQQGRPLYFVSQIQDVTARWQAEEQLRASEQRFRLVAEHALDNIWTMGLDYRFRYISPSVQSLVGYSVEEYLGLTLDQMLMPDSLTVTMAYCTRLQERRAAGGPVADLPFRGEIELRAKDGSGVWTEVIITPLVDGNGRLLELAGVTRDIRERKRYEAALEQARADAEMANRAIRSANRELQRLATTDRLTGIWNRAHFDEVAAKEIERAGRYGEALSLLLFDVDHFKAINDNQGHLVGDQVLIELSRRVGEQLRAIDVLARWGGEEFVVMLPHCGAAEALKVAEKLRALIQHQPFDQVGQITSSFGVADFRPADNLDTWLKRADDALYAAKAAGRNRVCMGD